jgi:methyl-accepting chemotaxis protein
MKLVVLSLTSVLFSSAVFSADVCSKKAAEDRVNEICKQVSAKGDAIKSEWPQGLLYKNCGDNYLWVQDTNAEIKMVMHPIKQRLNGQDLVKQTDENKFALFADFDKQAKAKPEGAWSEYVWTKPGQEKATPKIAFVKMCKLPSGGAWVVGSGIWKEDVK